MRTSISSSGGERLVACFAWENDLHNMTLFLDLRQESPTLVVPRICGAIGEMAQVILVWVRAPGHWECLPSTITRNHED